MVSLLTNELINETLQMITNGVYNSTLSQSNIIMFLKSVTGGLFQFNKKLFTKIDGWYNYGKYLIKVDIIV